MPVHGNPPAFQPSTIPNSANNLQKLQVVKVYDVNGNFIDVWPDAPLLGQGQSDTAPVYAINTIQAQITVTLPRAYDNIQIGGVSGTGSGTITPGNVVEFWVYDTNTLIYGKRVWFGYIDGYIKTIAQDGGETVQVTLTPFDTVLGDNQFVGTQYFGSPGVSSTYVDTMTMFNWPFTNLDPVTNQYYTNPLSSNSSTPTGNLFQLTFQNQSIADFFESIRGLSPDGYYWRCNHYALDIRTNLTSNRSVVFQKAASTAYHTWIIGKHVTVPQATETYQTLKNYIYVQGTGVKAVALGSDMALYGKRTYVINEPRIFDQASADQLAQSVLAQLDKPDLRATFSIADIRGDTTGLGYDIEDIRAGDTCRIINPFQKNEESFWDVSLWDNSIWDFTPDAFFNTVMTVAGFTYKYDSVDVQTSTLQPSQDRIIASLANTVVGNQLAQMPQPATPLMLYFSGLHPAATPYGTVDGSLFVAVSDNVSGTVSNKVGNATKWGEWIGTGNTAVWPSLTGMSATPSSKGWFLQNILLEGNTIIAGDWLPYLTLNVDVGGKTITADFVMRIWHYYNLGTLTQMGTNFTGTFTVTSSAVKYVFPEQYIKAEQFYGGDRIYVDLWVNIKTNGSGNSGMNLVMKAAPNSGAIGAWFSYVATPGFVRLPNSPI